MFTFASGLIAGFVIGLLLGYYSPKLFGKLSKKVGSAADDVRERL